MSTPDLNATAATLLGFLHDGPKTGWDLAQAVEASVGYFWNVTRSQVYRELKTLAAADLVESESAGARDKVPFAITARGRAAFDAWISRAPGPDLLRLPLVLTVFFGRHLAPERLTQALVAARAEHAGRLAAYRQIDADGLTGDEYQQATLMLGIAYEKAFLAWIDGLPWTGKGDKPRKKGGGER